MEKQGILKKLREVTKNNSIKFPSQIDFSLNNDTLNIHVFGNGVRDNMQTNGSAFEGWAICIISYLNVKKVILSWEKPQYSINEEEKNRQAKHYNRFIIRAFFFSKYYNWFYIDKSNITEVDFFLKNYSNLFVNYPKSDSKKDVSENGKINKGEAKLERILVDKMRLTQPITDHQLPVGIFINEVKKGNCFTPRGASQIDIWQLELEKNILRIFELKDKKNNEVGIISELLFYANIMNELINERIRYPQSIEKAKDIRHIKSLYEAIKNKSITKVEAVFLTYSLHPLISENLEAILKIINKGSNAGGIYFDYKKVEDIYA